MEKKNDFWNNTWFGFALKNVLKALAIIIGLILITLFIINIYTKHGQSEQVPNLKGITLPEAIKMLERHDLKAEIIDSVYVKDKKLGTIIEQNPAPNSIVKPGRHIYLIINSTAVRKIAFPEVRDLSLRQAEAMLKSIGINISSVQYAPSEYKDLILNVNYNGQILLTGTKIPEGSSVVLVAGNGQSVNTMLAPALKGLDLGSASQIINVSSFVVGGVVYDVAPNGDEAQYIVYRQRPEAGDSISNGSAIDLWLTKDRNRLNEVVTEPVKQQSSGKKQGQEKVKDIEDFF